MLVVFFSMVATKMLIVQQRFNMGLKTHITEEMIKIDLDFSRTLFLALSPEISQNNYFSDFI